MFLAVRNITRDIKLGRVRVARSLKDRLVGLLFTPELSPGSGLWIIPCHSVHTFFMRYAIDVLLLDAQGVVLAQRAMKPWQVSPWRMKAHSVLELAAGSLASSGTRVGDRIELREGY